MPLNLRLAAPWAGAVLRRKEKDQNQSASSISKTASSPSSLHPLSPQPQPQTHYHLSQPDPDLLHHSHSLTSDVHQISLSHRPSLGSDQSNLTSTASIKHFHHLQSQAYSLETSNLQIPQSPSDRYLPSTPPSLTLRRVSHSTTSPMLSPSSPQPLATELTIAVLHLQAINPVIRSTIESRLHSTGFKILAEYTIEISSSNLNSHLTGLSSSLASAFQSGQNLIYLLSRLRAIQVWKDLVGQAEPGSSNSNLPARPGSLKAMFGKEIVWAADGHEDVFVLMRRFWPYSGYESSPQFAHLLSSASPPASLSMKPISNFHPGDQSLQVETDSSYLHPQRRVFKFSQRVPSPVTEKIGGTFKGMFDIYPISLFKTSLLPFTSSN